MNVKSFLHRYQQDPWICSLAEQLNASSGKCIYLKGVSGSLDAVIAAALYKNHPNTQLFVLPNREEAEAFYSDLTHLLNTEEVVFYPALEDAQVMHLSVWVRLYSEQGVPLLIVTYPSALVDCVPQKEDFLRYMFILKFKQVLTQASLTTWLRMHGFVEVDFVHESGQFSIRGGIMDVFSCAHQLPFRISWWGDEVASLRTFDATTQRSSKDITQVSLVAYPSNCTPQHVKYQSFLYCLPACTYVWLKDQSVISATLQKACQRTKQSFDTPCLQAIDWVKDLRTKVTIAFGPRCDEARHTVVTYGAAPQPEFNKNIPLLIAHLRECIAQHIDVYFVGTSAHHLGQLGKQITLSDETITLDTLTVSLRAGFLDHHLGIACYTEHQIGKRLYRPNMPTYRVTTKAITLRALNTLQPGDYVVHVDYGIGRFAGLSMVSANGNAQEVVRLLYKNDDLVYVGLQSLHKLTKYAGKDSVPPAITQLGTSTWDRKKQRVKNSIHHVAKELIQLYSKRKQSPGYAFSADCVSHAALAASFMYEETPDQAEAIAAVTNDMEKPHPMDRLICGDVGFGKTEVAVRAAFKAMHDGKQVAILVPTTILALQHYRAFCDRLSELDITIAYINRFKSVREVRTILEAVQAGTIQLLIGTHQILGKQVKFHDLGLLIIDEEQKFGVKAKDKLKQFRLNVDILALTATPIPRTLHFSLMGARDLSIMTTPPPNRKPVATSIHLFDEGLIKNAITLELERGGQVFFVHHRITDIESMVALIHKLVPHARVGLAHGQLSGTVLEQCMLHFIQGDYDVLVTTSIIESGLDVPNVNTIIINNSHFFGLSDLHQMRGRVGRSDKRAFCYLLAPPTSSLSTEARRRLSAVEELSDLGAGFQVAMRDLDIRGAGNLFGAAQSGFMQDVGFETYCQLLDEAVHELKTSEFKTTFSSSAPPHANLPVSLTCTLESDLEALIPITYIKNTAERIHFYTRLDRCTNTEMLHGLQEELEDRFGPLPMPVVTLIHLVKLRWQAQSLGLSKLKLKMHTLKCYLDMQGIAKQSMLLARVIAYAQNHADKCRIQEIKTQLLLFVDGVTSIEEASAVLTSLVL